MRGRRTVWDAQAGGNRFEVGLYQGGELRVEQGARLLTREANVGYGVSTPGESGRVAISGADSGGTRARTPSCWAAMAATANWRS